jgi:hypothetical protein
VTDEHVAHETEAPLQAAPAYQSDRPPDEPPLESEGIGPLGILIGGVEEGVRGVINAIAGEELIDAVEHWGSGGPHATAPHLDLSDHEEPQVPDQHVEYEEPPPPAYE